MAGFVCDSAFFKGVGVCLMPCFHPINVPKKGYVDLRVTVACGRCVGCRIDRARDWQIRLLHESKLHRSSVFVTLTYDDQHLPANRSLVERDMVLFFKRLRKSRPGKHIPMFYCAEYGDRTFRPHYHAIVFGVDFPDKVRHSGQGGNTLYRSDELAKLWGKGFASFGSVTPESCRYVADYVFKRFSGDVADAKYSRVDPETGELYQVVPEYGRMSRRPAIGMRHYEAFRADYFPSDFAVVKGSRRPVPGAYTVKLGQHDPAMHQAIKRRRLSEAMKRRADSTPARLAVREEVARSKIALRKRDKV